MKRSFMYVVTLALILGAMNVWLASRLITLETKYSDLSDELSNLETHVVDFCDKEMVQS